MFRCICSRSALCSSISAFVSFFFIVLILSKNESTKPPEHVGHVGHIEEWGLEPLAFDQRLRHMAGFVGDRATGNRSLGLPGEPQLWNIATATAAARRTGTT